MSSKPQSERAPRDRARESRPWLSSVIWSAVVMALVLSFAVVVNLLIPGRVLHWDIISIMAVVGLIGLSIGRRLRFI